MTWPCLFMRRLGVPAVDLSMRGILSMVSDRSGFTTRELMRWACSSSSSANRARLAARDEAMWLMWNGVDADGCWTGHRYSLSQIGEAMGGLHHTTVLAATRRHEARMRTGLHTPLIHIERDWINSHPSTLHAALSTGRHPPAGVESPQIEQAEIVAA